MPTTENNYFNSSSNEKLFYYYKEGNLALPTIIFLSGYMSNINGSKANYLKQLCIKNNISYLCFDYSGHGNSSGYILNFTINDWLIDTENIINHFCNNRPKILVGSSMGGWLAFLYALKYQNYIEGLVTIAPALDFTSHLLELLNSNTLTANDGIITYTYLSGTKAIFSEKLITSTTNNLLLLNKPNIELNAKVRILHGLQDEIVNYEQSLLINQKLASNDVILSLVKNGDHSLSSEPNLLLLKNTILELVHN